MYTLNSKKENQRIKLSKPFKLTKQCKLTQILKTYAIILEKRNIEEEISSQMKIPER